MAGNLWRGDYAEMDDFVKDPVDSKNTFRGFKQYVKELDSNTLPPFLDRVCASDKKRSSYSEKEILCAFETAAEVHGRSIVPYIGQIVARITRIMASDARSLLSTDCSKVVCTLSRYCIDPLSREEEKCGILSSLCQPLSDCLMNSNESISSGCALCITALVQSSNWQFASNELVNDVCLKVSGALKEAHCQTVVHLSLVVALSKCNPLTLEPYGRSLIRSGLQILGNSTKARNSLLIMSSIQMIHCIMKSLDGRIISTEVSSIIHALEQFQDDSVPEVRAASVKAAETAKILGRQEEYGDEKKVNPFASLSGRHSRKGSNSPIDEVDIRDSGSSRSYSELQSVPSFPAFDSQLSVGQCMSNLGSTRAKRRLWSNGSQSSHETSNYEFFHTAALDSDDALGVRGYSSSAGLPKSSRRWSGVSRTGDTCLACLTPQAASSQVSRRRALSGDTRMQSSPRKQLHCFSSSRDSERHDLQFPASPALLGDIRLQSSPRKQLHCFSSSRDSERLHLQLPSSPALRQIQCSGHCSDHFLFQKRNDEFVEKRKGHLYSVQQGKQCHVENTDLLTEDLKFPNNSGCPDSAGAQCEKRQAEHEKMAERKKGEGKCCRRPSFLFFCLVLVVAFLFAWWTQGNNEIYVVPT